MPPRSCVASGPDWPAVRARYEHNPEITVAAICAEAGVTLAALRSRARRGGWRRGATTVHPTARGNAKPRRAFRRDLLDRLYAAIERHLETLELSAMPTDRSTPADRERETRALGSLIRNVEKVQELEGGLEASRARPAGPDEPVGADAADALGRELAERILRFAAGHRG